MSISNRELSINVPFQVSLLLAKQFLRWKLKCEKLTDDRRQELTKGPGKRVGLYMMSEHPGLILVNINTLGPYMFVCCHRMSENSGVGLHKFTVYVFTQRSHTSNNEL